MSMSPVGTASIDVIYDYSIYRILMASSERHGKIWRKQQGVETASNAAIMTTLPIGSSLHLIGVLFSFLAFVEGDSHVVIY